MGRQGEAAHHPGGNRDLAASTRGGRRRAGPCGGAVGRGRPRRRRPRRAPGPGRSGDDASPCLPWRPEARTWPCSGRRPSRSGPRRALDALAPAWVGGSMGGQAGGVLDGEPEGVARFVPQQRSGGGLVPFDWGQAVPTVWVRSAGPNLALTRRASCAWLAFWRRPLGPLGLALDPQANLDLVGHEERACPTTRTKAGWVAGTREPPPRAAALPPPGNRDRQEQPALTCRHSTPCCWNPVFHSNMRADGPQSRRRYSSRGSPKRTSRRSAHVAGLSSPAGTPSPRARPAAPKRATDRGGRMRPAGAGSSPGPSSPAA